MADGNLEVGLKVKLDKSSVAAAAQQTQATLKQSWQQNDAARAKHVQQLLAAMGAGSGSSGASRANAGGGAGFGSGWFRAGGGGIPPIIPPPVIRSGGGGGGGGGGGNLFGMFGAGALLRQLGLGGLISAGPIGGVIAVNFMLLKKASHELVKAFEQARSMFSKQLQSGGLPLGFVAQRSLMAEMLGVGEKEVYQYAEAVAFLNDKVRFATAVYQKTTPELAAASIELRALMLDIKSLGMLMANEFSQSIRKVILVLRYAIEDAAKLVKFTTYLTGAGAISRIIAKMIPGDMEKMPTPGAFSNRLPSSQFEKMGLVIGTGPGTNYPKETAQNTKRAANALEKLLNVIAPRAENQQPKTGNSP